ncbi:ribonuclease-like [Candoia aspera]|uniref:ribonuclease-like n=1 Tax=Candoia aspera TaxID=51853 RepID=UPI002FD7CD3A
MMVPFKESGHALLLLLTTVLILGSFAANYEDFLMKHYDNPKSSVGNRYCNAMMQRRGMTRPKCKQVNSFIHDTKADIIAVCAEKGVPYGNELRCSMRLFRVTTCSLKGSGMRPPCDYRETSSPKKIVIMCVYGKPVRYEEGIAVFQNEDAAMTNVQEDE